MTPKSPGIITPTAAARLFQRNNYSAHTRISSAGKGFMPFLKNDPTALRNWSKFIIVYPAMENRNKKIPSNFSLLRIQP